MKYLFEESVCSTPSVFSCVSIVIIFVHLVEEFVSRIAIDFERDFFLLLKRFLHKFWNL